MGSCDQIASRRAFSRLCQCDAKEDGCGNFVIVYVDGTASGLKEFGVLSNNRKEPSLVLLDCRSPLANSDAVLTSLTVPRCLANAAMGKRPSSFGGVVIRSLPDCTLTQILQAHLRKMAELDAIEHVERHALTRAATIMATALLSQLDADESDGTHGDATVLEAASRYMELNFWRHDLSPRRIASAASCSRAHLYRAFAKRGLTVAGQLQEIRLSNAKLLLETNSTIHIGTIAFDCGYGDPSVFGKAFRRRYEMTPAECRASVLERRKASPLAPRLSRPPYFLSA